MARTKIIFYGTDESGSEEHALQAYCNARGELFVSIEIEKYTSFICLDKPTAIKLSKELRRQISLMDD